METITISPKGVLYASMGLQSTGINYFVDGGQGRGSNKMIHAEKQKKDRVLDRNRPIVRQNMSAEGQAGREIYRRDPCKGSTVCDDDRLYITALFSSLHNVPPAAVIVDYTNRGVDRPNE